MVMVEEDSHGKSGCRETESVGGVGPNSGFYNKPLLKMQEVR